MFQLLLNSREEIKTSPMTRFVEAIKSGNLCHPPWLLKSVERQVLQYTAASCRRFRFNDCFLFQAPTHFWRMKGLLSHTFYCETKRRDATFDLKISACPEKWNCWWQLNLSSWVYNVFLAQLHEPNNHINQSSWK